MKNTNTELGVSIGFLGFALMMFSCWVRHLIWVISIFSVGAATISQIILGIIGTLIPPIGVIHGIMLFFGYVV